MSADEAGFDLRPAQQTNGANYAFRPDVVDRGFGCLAEMLDAAEEMGRRCQRAPGR